MKTSPTEYRIRDAEPSDGTAMLVLLPRLANFDVPEGRVPEDLWTHDAFLMRSWMAGEEPNCLVHVAVDANNEVIGLVMTSLRPELLSGDPSAHLEALLVASGAEGRGVGRALIDATESAATARGALSITLHVFGANQQARRLYARAGYDEELIRCSKPLRSVQGAISTAGPPKGSTRP